jgi:hypothetical protein
MEDDDDDDFSPEIYTHFVFEIKIVRVIENILVPSTLKFEMEFIPMDTAEENHIERAFNKMRWWLDNVISKSIVFSHENSAAIQMFIDEEVGHTRVGNVLVVTPEEPDDQHLAAIFQAKLQALAGAAMAFGPVKVKSDNSLGLQFTFVGDSSAVLPRIADWVGERTYFDKPWWDRDDGSTLDVLPPEDADLTVKPAWAFNFDFLDKPKKTTETSGKIVRPEFRPTVIDGGKSKGEDD